jgi:hypothetical protein
VLSPINPIFDAGVTSPAPDLMKAEAIESELNDPVRLWLPGDRRNLSKPHVRLSEVSRAFGQDNVHRIFRLVQSRFRRAESRRSQNNP